MSGGMQGGGVPDDLLTTKGDTHGFDTTNARVPIGANTTVLTADSTTALGLAWTAPTDTAPPTTTKGDLSGFSTVQSRIPVTVTNGHVLTSDSTEALGLKWAAVAVGGATVTAFEFTLSTDFSTSSSSYVDVTNLTVDKPTITGGECITTYNISLQNDNDGKLYSKLIDNTTAVAAGKSEFSVNKDTGLTASDTSTADGETLKVQIKASAGSSTVQHDFAAGGDRMSRICGLGVG